RRDTHRCRPRSTSRNRGTAPDDPMAAATRYPWPSRAWWPSDAGHGSLLTLGGSGCVVSAERFGFPRPSAGQRLDPTGDGPADLVRRILLEEMEPRDRHLGLRWQCEGEVEMGGGGKEETGLGLHEQLGYIARRQPVRVGGRDRSHVGGLALDRDFPGPRQRWPSPLTGLGERPSVFCHLLDGEG